MESTCLSLSRHSTGKKNDVSANCGQSTGLFDVRLSGQSIGHLRAGYKCLSVLIHLEGVLGVSGLRPMAENIVGVKAVN